MSRVSGDLVITRHVVSLWQTHDLFSDEIDFGIYGDWIAELNQGSVVLIISVLISAELNIQFGRWYYVLTKSGICGWIFSPFEHDPFCDSL